jgi:hypothetical protein
MKKRIQQEGGSLRRDLDFLYSELEDVRNCKVLPGRADFAQRERALCDQIEGIEARLRGDEAA